MKSINWTMMRTNSLGLKFQLNQIDEDSTEIQLVGTNKKIIVNVDLNIISRCWYQWQMRGEYVQNAFQMFTPSEREFIMTGITSQEWDETFRDNEE